VGIGYLRRGGLATHGARSAVTASLLLALACALACSRDATTPEDRIRAVLAALEEGAEARDAGSMKEHVAESYVDAQGNDKRAIAQLVAFQLLRNQSVYLLTRVREVAILAPGQGSAEVYVAMAGTPIEGPEALVGLRADLYRFDLQLAEEPDGEWRVRSAQWRPAAVDDFR
jgi:hypothetical protein